MVSREFRVFALRMDSELKQAVLESADAMGKVNLKIGNKRGAKKYKKISEQAIDGIRKNAKEIGELAEQASGEIARVYKTGAIGITIVGIIIVIGLILKMRG